MTDQATCEYTRYQGVTVDEEGRLLIGGRAADHIVEDLSYVFRGYSKEDPTPSPTEGDQLEMLGSTFECAALALIEIPEEMLGTVTQGSDLEKIIDVWLHNVERASQLMQTATACYNRADKERQRYERIAAARM